MALYNFVKWDEDAVLEDAIQNFEDAAGESLYAGDERRMIINTFGYLASVLAGEINYRANQNLIQFMDEENLILYGAQNGLQMNAAGYSAVMERFTLSSTRAYDITIPKGTRVTPDGVIFFATDTAGTIAAGSLYIDISCTATTGGDNSGIAVGSIATLVDNINYITTVSNTTVSTGGSDAETLEEFRSRVINRPYTYSTAGAKKYYEEVIKANFPTVSTVIALTGTIDGTTIPDGTVKVLLMLDGGVVPGTTFLASVKTFLDQENIKPITDKVIVAAPDVINYSITASYYIKESDASKSTTIHDDIIAAVNAYTAENDYQIGNNINPDLIRNAILNAGAYTVTITAPTITKITRFQVTKCTAVNITNSGVFS